MASRLASSTSVFSAAVNIPTTTETIACTCGPVNPITDSAQIFLFWDILLQPGTGTNAATVRLRRGSTATGAVVNVGFAVVVLAGNTIHLPGHYVDTVAAGAELTYTITVQQAAATANGTIQDFCFTAMVL